jgi:Domain of unknown function (DUF4328)
VTDAPFPPPPPPPSPLAAPGGYPAAWSTPLAPTAGLRAATVALFWSTSGAMALTAAAAWNRLVVWNGFRDGSRDIFEVDDADTLIALAATLQIGLALASAIVVSIWSLRATRNAAARGEGSPSPGLACGGWYIPFGMFVVPFVQFRKVLRARRQAHGAVNWWQGLFIAAGVCSFAVRGGDPERVDSIEDVADALGVQTAAAVLGTVVLAAATIAATRAMRDLDRV